MPSVASRPRELAELVAHLHAQELDGLVHVAAGLLERGLAVHHPRAGLLAQRLDVRSGDRGHVTASLLGRLCGVGRSRRGAARRRASRLGGAQPAASRPPRVACGIARLERRPRRRRTVSAPVSGAGGAAPPAAASTASGAACGAGRLAPAASAAASPRRASASRRPAPRPRASARSAASRGGLRLGLGAGAAPPRRGTSAALGDHVGDRVGDDLARADRVVVARDHVVDPVRDRSSCRRGR